MSKWWVIISLVAQLLVYASHAEAGIVIGGTRVIYDASQREASLSVSNPEGGTPFLVQSWTQNINGSDTNKVPFVITPPLFRLDPGQQNMLRIVRVGGQLAENRESVFMLNVKSIPSSKESDVNQLQITVKSQFKLFYRPSSLKGQSAADAYKALKFSRHDNQLKVSNPTPFYVSFYAVNVNGVAVEQPQMVAPYASLSWSVQVPDRATITWQSITDYGGVTKLISAQL